MKNVQIVERAIPELQPLNAPLDKIETGDLRQLARGLGINLSFNPEEPANVERLLRILELPAEKRRTPDQGLARRHSAPGAECAQAR